MKQKMLRMITSMTDAFASDLPKYLQMYIKQAIEIDKKIRLSHLKEDFVLPTGI